MPTYTIHLRTTKDFRSYANLTCRFRIAGYVQQGSFRESMYCLLEIMSECPLDNLTLTLTKYEKEEIPALEAYLSQTGLLNTASLKTRQTA